MKEPSESLLRYFPFKPTSGQEKALELLNAFILDKTTSRNTFLLKGYAGTGKTSLLSILVGLLRTYECKTVLLAPTGRAAKVLSAYSKKNAFTIHKVIYKRAEDPVSGKLFFSKVQNKAKKTIYIVDEASMINEQSSYGGKGLLSDLIDYVFQFAKSANKLILTGDTAQLPPVCQLISPALDIDNLSRQYELSVVSFTLTEVARQASQSGILANATLIRQQIEEGIFALKITTAIYSDVYAISSAKLEDGLRYAYDKFGINKTVIACRSNKSATMYNQYIRQQIHFSESEIDTGDCLIIVKNNYHWLAPESQAGFFANGDFAEVMYVNAYEQMYDMRFADLTLRLLDYPDQPPFEAKVHLQTLHAHTPALSEDELQHLRKQVEMEHAHISDPVEYLHTIRQDPYLHALQVKFAHALTCHKAQGGQWDAVFVDLGYLREEILNIEFLRWIYTAFTRAKKELYLINFPEKFLSH